jgi:hypothetical protein
MQIRVLADARAVAREAAVVIAAGARASVAELTEIYQGRRRHAIEGGADDDE